MRHLLLAMILCSTWSAEELTLTDGRKLVGTYDDATEMLDMKGAQLKVAAASIASRREMPAEAAPAAVAPAPAKAAARGGLKERLDDCRARYAALEKQAKEIQAKADAVNEEFYLSWVKSADLSTVPEDTAGADPKVSEIKRAEKVRNMNITLRNLEKMRGYAAKKQAKNGLSKEFVDASQHFLDHYLDIYLETHPAAR